MYPVLLLIAVVACRRWRVLGGCMAVLAVSTLLDPTGWQYFVAHRAAERSGWRTIDEAAGLFTFYRLLAALAGHYLSWTIAPESADVAAKVTFVGLATILAGAQLRWGGRVAARDSWKAMACWLPLAVSVPGIVYAYSLVQLVPVAFAACAFYGDRRATPAVRKLAVLAGVGIGLAQIQVKALETVWQSGPPPDLIGGLCAPGLFLASVSFIALALLTLPRETPPEVSAAPS